jgi:EF hand
MKTNEIYGKLGAIALALAVPVSVIAQAPANPSTGGTANPPAAGATGTSSPTRPGSPRQTGPQTSSTTGLGSMPNSPLSNPEALFKQLDTNHDGKLTQEEFIQIQSAIGARPNPGVQNPAPGAPATTAPGTKVNPSGSGTGNSRATGNPRSSGR